TNLPSSTLWRPVLKSQNSDRSLPVSYRPAFRVKGCRATVGTGCCSYMNAVRACLHRVFIWGEGLVVGWLVYATGKIVAKAAGRERYFRLLVAGHSLLAARHSLLATRCSPLAARRSPLAA